MLPAGLARGSPKRSRASASAPPNCRLAAGGGLHRAKDTMRHAGGAVRHRAGAARRGAAGKGRDMRHGLGTLFEDQPLVAGAIAMALGAASEALSRARESKIRCSVSKAIERWRQRTLAKDQGAKVQATASAVVNEALNIADEPRPSWGRNCPRGKRSSTSLRARSARRPAGYVRQAVGCRPEPDGGAVR